MTIQANIKKRKCWKCNNEHTRIGSTGRPTWFRRYIKGVPNNEYECYYCYNKIANPNGTMTNIVPICGHYKRYTIIDEKPRWIVVNDDGYVMNKNPTKEELKNIQMEHYKTNTNNRKYTNDQLLKYLEIFAEENGRFPSQNDFEHNPKYPSISAYRNHFKSWTNALKLVKMDMDTRVMQGNLETESHKGRLAELLVIKHFKNNPIDLSGENYKSPYDGICPNGMIYDVKSSKLYIHRHRWKYVILNKYKHEIEIFYFLAFNEDYTRLLHIWRMPGDIIESDYFTVKIGKTHGGISIEDMKKFEITEKFENLMILNK